MPSYMDIHEIPGGVSAEDVAKAHAHDVSVQDKYGVKYHKYWVNEKAGKIFCLCHAPNAEAAKQVHREAHGLVAEKVIQVEPEMADLFMGAGEINGAGAVVLPGAELDQRDPGIRTILFTDIVESTAMTHRMGDEIAMELLGVHDKIVRDALADLGGHEVKHLGDGIMASSGKSKTVHFKFGPVLPPANRLSTTTIFLAARSNWRPDFVRMRNRSKFWFRTWSPSCAKEKHCLSRTLAKLRSKVSINLFVPTP